MMSKQSGPVAVIREEQDVVAVVSHMSLWYEVYPEDCIEEDGDDVDGFGWEYNVVHFPVVAWEWDGEELTPIVMGKGLGADYVGRRLADQAERMFDERRLTNEFTAYPEGGGIVRTNWWTIHYVGADPVEHLGLRLGHERRDEGTRESDPERFKEHANTEAEMRQVWMEAVAKVA